MNKGFSLLLIIPGLLSLFMTFVSLALADSDYTEFEEYRLERTNNYATDAALQEVLEGDDLEQDYLDTDRVIVDPDIARDTYLSLLALNYDIPITQDSLKALSAEYLDVFIVTAYDGYYVYNRDGVAVVNDTNDTILKDYTSYTFTKLPYVYNVVDSTTGDIKESYSFDMDFKLAYKLCADHVEKVNLEEDSIGLTKEKGYSLINQIINKEINTRLELSLMNGSLGTVMIPEAATKVGMVNNAVEGISVLAFVDNVNFTTARRLNAFSIGGSKVRPTRMIACYTRDGKRYYAYVDELKRADIRPNNFDIDNVNKWAEYVVTSMEEAARLGYYYDVALMEQYKKG